MRSLWPVCINCGLDLIYQDGQLVDAWGTDDACYDSNLNYIGPHVALDT